MGIGAGYDVRRSGVEWYTPGKYIVSVRAVMGEIDLDPASCELANTIVRAKKYYTLRDNGLFLPWYGRVFCNPPYGKVDSISEQERWSSRLIYEFLTGNVAEAILLTSSSDTSTKWYHRLLRFPHCNTDHRIKFWTSYAPLHSKNTRAMAGSVFTYFGGNVGRFFDAFEQFGTCCYSCRTTATGQTILDEIIKWGVE